MGLHSQLALAHIKACQRTMSEEGDKTPSEAPPAEEAVAAEEAPAPAKKAGKAKKEKKAGVAKPKKEKKPTTPAAHPKYSVMIAAAITALKSRTGSSRQAILKYIVANYKVDAAKAAVQVRLALKRGVAKGALKMARASGKGAGSYKVVN